MSVLVVDASFALKWLVDEGDRESAIALALDHELSAPDIIDLEIWNALWRRRQLAGFERDKIEDLFQAFKSVPIALQPVPALLPRARSLSVQLDATVFDCLYWADRDRSAGKFATGDAKFVGKLRSAGMLSGNVILF